MQQHTSVSTDAQRQVMDITNIVADSIPKNRSGVVTVFVMHTTAAAMVLDLDPGMDDNLVAAVDQLLPRKTWQHAHDNSYEHVTAHLLSALIGPSVCVPYRRGELLLGTWQRIVLVELDGPRERSVIINA